MASITVGGKNYDIAPLTFYQIEKAWPCFLAAQAETDSIATTGHYLGFVAAILEDAEPAFADVTALKKAMLMTEMPSLADTVRQILVENKMIDDKPPAVGETQPAPEVAAAPADEAPVGPSTETAPA